ncbi:hypothetical protein DFS33DRAFT_1489906 [Desarmillaria ectypa]|nr:hypothetical protein DFS33DRAFT_1489906 [Desarmillaria ectypa]
MSDQHQVNEVSSRRFSDSIPDVQGRPERLTQNNGSKLRQNNEQKLDEMEIGKEHINSDSNAPFNYEDKYPKDNVYEEAVPNARVWRTYLDESTNYDARMVGESRDSVDVLLVFVSIVQLLFFFTIAEDIVGWAFLSGGDNLHITDITELTGGLYSGISCLALQNVSSLNPYVKFAPATMDIWVDGLWFTSLSLSLATALVAVLLWAIMVGTVAAYMTSGKGSGAGPVGNSVSGSIILAMLILIQS